MLDRTMLATLLRDEPFAASHGAGGHEPGALPLYYSLAIATRAKTCVVLGSGHGLVPKCLAMAQRWLGLPGAVTWLIDGDCEVAPGWGGPDYFARPELLQGWPEIRPVKELTQTAHRLFADGSVDLLHVDADHTYQAARHDFTIYAPKVRPGGLITLHDTANQTTGCGVDQLVEEIRAGQLGDFDLLDLPTLGVGVAIVRHR